ncbi:uncharacterized protein C8Q71DRAFT_693096, partial [Rhodofomes roseus]
DYPEQCLVACCMENRCPMCQVPPDGRGNHEAYPARDKDETLSLLREQDSPANGVLAGTTETRRFKELGLRPVYPPFWVDLPHSNVFEWFTPDLLHQIHKGVFKDHVVKWCTAIVGEDELDARFRAMSNVTGLRHFAHGISTVSQWTGHEHKEMERVFLGVLMGRADAEVVRAVRAVLDFINLAALHSHTTETLALLRQSLDDFHAYKNVFIELGARTQSHFNIPKLHAIEHYATMILKFGSADGFNTESPERLHIDYAKDAYRASNHKDYVAQMVTWLRRQEAVDRFARYLTWCRDGSPSSPQVTGALDVASEQSRAAVPVVPSASSPVMYKLPNTQRKTSLKGITAATIMEEHHAPQFLASLTAYLRRQGSSFTPQPFDGFTLYARLATRLPQIDVTGSRALKNVVRASPPAPAQGRQLAKAAHLDFALVRTGEPNETTAGTPLEGKLRVNMAGLRVAHVRAIFTLPHHYNVEPLHPLAYVEWMTPFHRVDPDSGQYILTPSTRQQKPYGEVIEIDRIVRNCHLWPAFGRAVDGRWSTDNVSELCTRFYFNSYFDPHTF